MSRTLPDRLQLVLRLVLAAFYLAAGYLHLTSPGGFLRIMPPVIPFPQAVVAFTGVCEIAGALGLLVPQTRRWAGAMLALYALCVWPANLYHAFWGLHVPPLPDSWWYHGPRLAFQPVLIWWALFAGGAVRWPLRSFPLSGRPKLQFSFARFVVFSVVGLPLGFILTALVFAVANLPISAPQIFPWALGIAGIAGAFGGFWRSSD